MLFKQETSLSIAVVGTTVSLKPFLPLYIDSGGSWSDWGSWSSCSQTCNGGRRSRTRTCEDGADCEGSNIDIEQCNTQACASEWLQNI